MECPRTGEEWRAGAAGSRTESATGFPEHVGIGTMLVGNPSRPGCAMARRSATCEQQLLHAHGDRAAVIDPRRRDLSRRFSSARSSGRGAGPRGSRGPAAGCRSCTCRRGGWSVRFGRLPGWLVPGSWRPGRPPVPWDLVDRLREPAARPQVAGNRRVDPPGLAASRRPRYQRVADTAAPPWSYEDASALCADSDARPAEPSSTRWPPHGVPDYAGRRDRY